MCNPYVYRAAPTAPERRGRTSSRAESVGSAREIVRIGEASEEQDGREAAEVDEAQASRSSVGMGGRASIKQGDDGTGCKSRGNDNRNKARVRKRQIQIHLHNREGEPEGDGGSRQKGFQEHGTADAPEGGMGSLAEKVSARNQHGGTGAVHKLHGSPSSLRS